MLAIPFFVLAGVILDRAGLAATIARFFELLVGKSTGGLAMVAVLTCIFWGALSGSGPATTAAVGMILLTPMIRHGYDKSFAGATIANASDLSIIIPPSIAFIIYGNITSVSVSALFVARHRARTADRCRYGPGGLSDLQKARLSGRRTPRYAPKSCGRPSKNRSGPCWRRW